MTGIEKIAEYLEALDIRVKVELDTPGDESGYYEEEGYIRVGCYNTSTNKQLAILAHEAGHVVAGVTASSWERYLCYKGFEVSENVKRDEVHAWHEGERLLQWLCVQYDKESWDKEKAAALATYEVNDLSIYL